MSDRAALLRLLSTVEQRVRALAAVQGAVFGLNTFLVIGVVHFVVARLPGGPTVAISPLMLATAFAMAGAIVGYLRHVPLERCARAVDWTTGKNTGSERRNGDRTLAALSFLERTETEPFADAAVGDARRSAANVRLSTVVPWRRPRGLLPGAGLGALLLALTTSTWPRPTTDAGRDALADSDTSVFPGGTIVPAERLRDEQEVLSALAKAAIETKDDELAGLTREMKDLLAKLTGAGVEGQRA